MLRSSLYFFAFLLHFAYYWPRIFFTKNAHHLNPAPVAQYENPRVSFWHFSHLREFRIMLLDKISPRFVYYKDVRLTWYRPHSNKETAMLRQTHKKFYLPFIDEGELAIAAKCELRIIAQPYPLYRIPIRPTTACVAQPYGGWEGVEFARPDSREEYRKESMR